MRAMVEMHAKERKLAKEKRLAEKERQKKESK